MLSVWMTETNRKSATRHFIDAIAESQTYHVAQVESFPMLWGAATKLTLQHLNPSERFKPGACSDFVATMAASSFGWESKII